MGMSGVEAWAGAINFGKRYYVVRFNDNLEAPTANGIRKNV